MCSSENSFQDKSMLSVNIITYTALHALKKLCNYNVEWVIFSLFSLLHSTGTREPKPYYMLC